MKLPSNYLLQRTVVNRGRTVLAMDRALAGAERAPWPAAEQERWASPTPCECSIGGAK